MLNLISKCVILIICFSLNTNSRQALNISEAFSSQENDQEKTRDLISFDVAVKSKSRGRRIKRSVLEDCSKGSRQETEETTCPLETYPRLMDYGCCINCPEQETGVGCELHNCMGIHSCESVPDPPLFDPFLNLEYRNIALLSYNVFSGLSGLTYLILSNNNISVLPYNVFSGLSGLTDLILSNNNISVLPYNVFSGLSGLTDLILSNNNITVLPYNVFSGLSKLTVLYLSNNNISVLPYNVFSGLSGLTHLDLSNNNITVLPYNVFSGLSGLTDLILSNNNITVLPYNVFSGLSGLTYLDLSNNNITVLPYNVFSGLSKLTVLYLSDNNITVLPCNVFSGLSGLAHLDLSNNNIPVLPYNVFSGLSGLAHLDLSNNNISVLPYNVFSGLSKLTVLYLSDNNITVLPYNVFSGLSGLTYLDLSNNNIPVLPYNVFSGLSGLTYLDLSNNNIPVLPYNVFSGLSKLTVLYLSDNNITVLPYNVFSGLSGLANLDLSNNNIPVLPYNIFSGIITDEHRYLRNNESSVLADRHLNLGFLDLANNLLTYLPHLPRKLNRLNIMGNKLEVAKHMFAGLDNLNTIYTDIPFMCCVKPTSVDDNNCIETNHSVWYCWQWPHECKSNGDAISSCYALVSSDVLRACLWIIGICAFIGNMAVIFYRLFIDRDNITKSYSLFTLNLAISDLLMGVYLLIVGVVDAYYYGEYAWNDHIWRNSTLCTIAGVLSTVSSEMSTFLILLVTVDRLIVIVFPLSRLSRWKISWERGLIVSVSLWIVSITLAIIPIAAIQSYFRGEFYSQSSVCLALPLTGDERPGTEYSFAVFVCLNSIVFVVIVVCQICIIKSMRTSGRRITSSQNRQREITVAMTLFFVVVTDFCCWFPIGVMGVISRLGVEIPDDAYAWVMVFVLPINSAINPFLYTATAIWRRRRNTPTPMTPPIQLQRLPAAIAND